MTHGSMLAALSLSSRQDYNSSYKTKAQFPIGLDCLSSCARPDAMCSHAEKRSGVMTCATSMRNKPVSQSWNLAHGCLQGLCDASGASAGGGKR